MYLIAIFKKLVSTEPEIPDIEQDEEANEGEVETHAEEEPPAEQALPVSTPTTEREDETPSRKGKH